MDCTVSKESASWSVYTTKPLLPCTGGAGHRGSSARWRTKLSGGCSRSSEGERNDVLCTKGTPRLYPSAIAVGSDLDHGLGRARCNADPCAGGERRPGLVMNSLSGIPAGGLIPMEEDLSVMVVRADLVVWGRVDTAESYWVSSDQRGQHIYTRLTIQPSGWALGELTDTPVVLEVPGGMVGETTELVSNMPGFRAGEEAIIFLRESPRRLVGGHDAKLKVDGGKVYWAGRELSAVAFLKILNLIAAGESPVNIWNQEVQKDKLTAAALTPQIYISPRSASAGTDTPVEISAFATDATAPWLAAPTIEFFYRFGKERLLAPVSDFRTGVTDVEVENQGVVGYSYWRSSICTVPVGEVDGYPASASSGPVTASWGSLTSDPHLLSVTFGYLQARWYYAPAPVASVPWDAPVVEVENPGPSYPTVWYRINVNGSGVTGAAEAIERAAERWNAAGARFRFTGGEDNTATNKRGDGQNDIMWGPIDDETVNAVAHVW